MVNTFDYKQVKRAKIINMGLALENEPCYEPSQNLMR